MRDVLARHVFLFFFFKQKTAYGLRISDWIPAVCSSDLPWADRAAFAELMLGWELRSWHEAHDRAGPVICDCSVPDVAGYLRLCGLPVPAHVSQAVALFRYQPRVFIAPLARDLRGRCGKKTGFRATAVDLSGAGRGLFRSWLRAGDPSPRLCRLTCA